MYGLTGFAVASIASEAVALATRTWYLHRLFEHFNVLRHCLRAVAPTLPAVAAVLLVRALEQGDRTGAMVVGEVVLFVRGQRRGAVADRAPPPARAGRLPARRGAQPDPHGLMAHDALAAEVAAIPWYHTMELRAGRGHPGLAGHPPGRRARCPSPLARRDALPGRRPRSTASGRSRWSAAARPRSWPSTCSTRRGGTGRSAARPRCEAAIGERQARRARLRDRQARARARPSSGWSAASTTSTPRQDGEFDVVYLGSLLVHLRDPVRALERIRAVCRGTLIVVDGIDLPLSLLFPRLPVARFDGRGRPWWWYSNAAGAGAAGRVAAASSSSQRPRRLYMPPGPGQPLAGARPARCSSPTPGARRW